MLKRIFLAIFCAFAVVSSHSQIRVELAFEQETYLPHEPLQAIVRVYNSSGQTLLLGQNEEWLSFIVESTDGRIIRQLKNPDVVGEFELPSAHRAKKFVNLAEAWELTKYGRYLVTAVVKVPGWGDKFVSKEKHFGISPGVTLWETVFGIPGADANDRPEFRKYLLVQANHLKELTLYIKITDQSESETYKLFPVGPMISFSKPEPQMDKFSNLHVLYQDGARSFRYTMVTPDGLLLSRQTWLIHDESRPALKVAEDGRIAVSGGLRKVSASDLPPPEMLSESKAPALSPTNAGDTPLDASSKKK